MAMMIWIALTCVVWLFTLVSGELPAVSNNNTGNFQDICKQGLIQLKGANETGRIGFDSLTTGGKSAPCILKIESCPTCQIIIEPELTTKSFDFYCQTGLPNLKHHCTLGCDYLYMFDVYYVNETMHVIRTWNSSVTTWPFRSESSSVYVVLCHGPTNYRFTLKYRTVKKHKNIDGSSFYSSTGFLQSPFFPASYYQNFETYEFVFSSPNSGDYITLTFDDWDLDSSSAFYFEGSNIVGPVYGSTTRPNVISDKNYMKVLFNTGQPMLSNVQSGNMGFKARYTFINDRQQFRNPKTSCKGAGYLLDSKGGLIEFSKETQPQEYFDCIWVIKAQPGYSGVYMKLMKKRIPKDYDYPYRRNQIQIRSGLTSNGRLVSTIYAEMSPDDYKAHLNEIGFYVRINATLLPSDSVILAYASYKETYVTDCKHDSTMFECSNGRCIDRFLVCDGYDHCGDNTDETTGCSDGDTSGLWDKSYQYTITIGVIVPMVISVFLIMVICLLFVMIRRCRRARLREAGMNERLQTLSEEVATRRGRRRRRRRRFFGSVERDAPPTYDEAIQNPPGWYDNVAFGTAADPTLPQPPSYTEAVGTQPALSVPPLPLGSPSSTDSSQSDLTIQNENQPSSSSSSEGGSPWELGRRQPRNRQRTDTSHVSSSESEMEDTETSQNRQNRNGTDTSLLAGGSDLSTLPNSNSNKRVVKDTQKEDRSVNREIKLKNSDKTNQKDGPNTYNCVVPDSNKVRSSRSMELLPTLSLFGGSLDSNEDSVQKPEGEQVRAREVRIGGPQSLKNGSCPQLSGNLTVYRDEPPTYQTNSSSAYPTQHRNDHRSRTEQANLSRVLDEAQRGCDDRSKSRNSDEVVNRENRYMPVSSEETNKSANDVMVVYDGPNITNPSPTQSPTRTSANLKGNEGSQSDCHGRSDRYQRDLENSKSRGHHGNTENQGFGGHRGRSPSKTSSQPHSGHADQKHKKTGNQRRDPGQESSHSRENNLQNAPIDRRLAHLPIINQIRKTVGQSRALQSSDRSRGMSVNTGSSEIDRHGNDRDVPYEGQTDHYGNNRVVPPDQTGHRKIDGHGSSDGQTDRRKNDRHSPRRGQAVHHGNDRHVPRDSQSDRHGNDRHVPRDSQSDHHGNDRHVPRDGQSGRHGNDRHVPRDCQSDRHGNDRHVPRDSQSDHYGNERHVPSDGQSGRHGNDRHARSEGHSDRHGNDTHRSNLDSTTVSRPDQTNISPTHRGYSDRKYGSENEAVPVVAIASGQTNNGAIKGGQDNEDNHDPNSDSGYLNLYRIGGEDDDIYV